MSVDLKMAWRNIWRNPRRTILTISAIAFAALLLVFMLSFQFGSYEAMINSSVNIQTGHLQVQAKGYQEKQDINLIVPDPAEIGGILEKIDDVKAFTFRAQAFSLVSSGKRTYGVAVIGVDPSKEAMVSSLKTSVRQGEYFSGKDNGGGHGQALVGRLLAKNLHAGTGDELTVIGQGRDGSIAATVVTVKGIYSSGMDEFDRNSIHIPLKLFQDTYSMHGAVNRVVVVAKSLGRVAKIKNTLVRQLKHGKTENRLKVLDWQQLMPGLRQAIEMDLVSGIIYYLILILVVAFSILNTFLMAIFERTKEFGVLMAIGTTPGRLMKLMLIESMSMTMIGIVSGIFLGCMITLYFQVHGIDISGSSEILSQFGISGRLYPKLSLLSALTGPAAVCMITFFSALYPALKIRGLRPVEAMG